MKKIFSLLCLTTIFTLSNYQNTQAMHYQTDTNLIKKELQNGTFPLINLSKKEKNIVLNCIYECLASLTISIKINQYGAHKYCYIVRPKIHKSLLEPTQALTYLNEKGFRFGGSFLKLTPQKNDTSTQNWGDLLYHKSNHIKIESLLCYLRALLGTEQSAEEGFSDFLSAIDFSCYDVSLKKLLFDCNHF